MTTMTWTMRATEAGEHNDRRVLQLIGLYSASSHQYRPHGRESQMGRVSVSLLTGYTSSGTEHYTCLSIGATG